jgi:hypothetical protein
MQGMVIQMNDEQFLTLAQLQAFVIRQQIRECPLPLGLTPAKTLRDSAFSPTLSRSRACLHRSSSRRPLAAVRRLDDAFGARIVGVGLLLSIASPYSEP